MNSQYYYARLPALRVLFLLFFLTPGVMTAQLNQFALSPDSSIVYLSPEDHVYFGVNASLLSQLLLVSDAEILPNGKLLVAYRASSPKSSSPPAVYFYAQSRIRLFNTDGTVVNDFGGLSASMHRYDIQILNFSQQYLTDDQHDVYMATAPGGKIVSAGYRMHNNTSQTPETFNGIYAGSFVLRLDSNGVADPGFNGTGSWTDIMKRDLPPDYGRISAVAVQNDGTIIVARQVPSGTAGWFFVYLTKFSESGSILNDGLSTGFLLPSSALHAEMVIRPNGKIITASTWNNLSVSGLYIGQVNSDLTGDNSFGNNTIFAGNDTINFPVADSIVVQKLLLQPDGKLLILCQISDGSGLDAMIVRLNENGSRDASFGSNGIWRRDFYGGNDRMRRMALQRDGKILIAGSTDSSGYPSMTVARLLSDGTVDTGFENNGVFRSNLIDPAVAPNAYILGDDVDIAPDGNILVTGSINNGGLSAELLYLVRQNPSQFYYIDSLSPAQGTVKPGKVDSLVLTFGRQITAQSGKNISIYTAAGALVEQIPVTDSRVTIGAYSSAKYQGAYPLFHHRQTLTIHPSTPLVSGSYYVKIDSGAVKNSEGYDFWGINDNTTWRFGVAIADTVPGKALSIPGSGSYVDVPFSSILNPSDNFTVEFWARLEGGSDYRCPLGAEDGSAQTGYYFYADPSNVWQCWMGKGSPNGWSVISGPTAVVGRWYHLAMTYAVGIQKFYVDGELQGSLSAVFAVNPSFPLRIGGLAESGSIYGWVGKIDEVRIWNIVRTQLEIREAMHRTIPGNTNGLIAYFQLNEGSGTTTKDAAGSFTGTITGSPVWVTSTIPAGTGSSTTQAAFSTGTANLGTVIMTMTDGFDNAVDLTGTQIGIPPDSTTGISGTPLSDRYWVINSFGTPGTFAANLTFTVPSSFTNNGAGSASDYTLYHRSGNGEGSWSSAVSGASALTNSTITFNGIGSFSQFTIGTSGSLPVELTEVTAARVKNNIEVKWKTATEVNNYGFEVERKKILLNPTIQGGSRVAGEGEGFMKVGFVKGNGTTNSPKEYSFTDKNLIGEKYSYRLKQIDNNGKFKYSQEVEVTAGAAPKVFSLNQNYPNPFNPTTTIGFTLQVSGFTTLKIYDVIGREVATLVNENLKAGEFHQATFNASNLASGVYFAWLQSGKQVQLKKLLLMK